MVDSLCMSDSAIHDFVLNHSDGAHLKESEKGTYILANQATLDLFGKTKTEDILNADIHDLDRFMRPYWGDSYAENIAELDDKAKANCAIITKKNDITVSVNDEIVIQDILKLPLVNKSNKTTAILTVLTDRTQDTDLFCLFELYKKKYANKNKAIVNFVKFLKLDGFFQEDLTCKELLCLLNMRYNPAYKSIAGKLGIRIKTVESHISHIIGKLNGVQLSTVLSSLRGRR